MARVAEAVTGRPVRRTSFVLRGLKHDTEEQPSSNDEAGVLYANPVVATTSKRRAILVRQKGVRSLRKKLLR